MKKRLIEKVEFYITNVCNLTCDHCNRFNNFNFKGWQRWSDHAQDYERWSEYVDFKQIVILGGEPLLNPDIGRWITGINRLWGPVQVLTNGTMLNRVPNLYRHFNGVHKNWLTISMHNTDFKQQDKLFGEIEKFLKPPVRITQGRHNHSSGADYEFTDKNQVKVALWDATDFQNTSLVELENQSFTLHQSDPVKAHSVCGFVRHKNYHFIRGKFYKCGPVALLPEFDKQFNLDISQEDRALLTSYKPLSVDEYETRGDDFFAALDNPIEQCKFCPESFSVIKIAAITK